ncbi:MAG: ATP-binding protein [Cytophagales bacterium]|jgi:predicted HTH transcriptional regulator|nr:ATP-binding protein [Cytophagales bacterium]
MDFAEVKALARQGEGLHVEFKLKAAHPEKIVRELVAFANTRGGTLLVGVSDDRLIKGVRFVDEEEYILTKAIQAHCFPPFAYEIHHIPLDDNDERHVLAVTVPPSPDKPHYVRPEPAATEGKAYVRVADRSIQASKEVREILKGERKQRNIRFEYGKKENQLMQYLAQHRRITVSQFMEVAAIPRHVASRTLVLLSLARVLRILPDETQDFFEVLESV